MEAGGHPLYGEDNLPNPWQNEQLTPIQKAFNPVLVVDTDYWRASTRVRPVSGPLPRSP